MSKRLLFLNGLAVLGLVLHHASGYGFRAMFYWTDVYQPVTVPNFDQAGSLSFYATVFIQQLDSFTLPAFMFVSGFFAAFMFGGGKKRFGVAVTRVKNLLIPFGIWTFLYIGLLNRRLPSSFDEIITRYYYIPLLCQYYLLAPLIIPLVRKRWKVLLSILAIFEFGGAIFPYLRVFDVGSGILNLWRILTPKWLIPNLLFWFVLGNVANVHRQKFSEWLERNSGRLLALTLSLIVLSMVEYIVISRVTEDPWLGQYFGGISRSLYALAFILAVLAYGGDAVPFSNEVSKLGSKSLGVYLVHSIVMYVAAVWMYRLTPWVLGQQILYQGILLAMGLTVPILFMGFVANSPARKGYRYIFG